MAGFDPDEVPICLFLECLLAPGFFLQSEVLSHFRVQGAVDDVLTCKVTARRGCLQRVHSCKGKSTVRLSHVSLCIGSLTRIPPNTQLHPIAPTLAAPRAPTHPIGASSLWKAWNSQPVTPEAASIAAWGREPRWPQHQCQD